MSRNEATTRLELIDPQIKSAGWGANQTIGSQIVAEYTFTDGRLIGAGERGKQKKADYVLAYNSQKLAIVEAKAEDKEVTDGLEQVKDYAKCLDTRFVYSTNGHGIYLFDMQSGTGREVDGYHSPDELFDMTFGELKPVVKSAISEPFQREKYGPRYYQENAINTAVQAISGGEPRVLLTLATGTGKTFISFQIVWKLFQARWNRRGDGRRPRVLFLADRNVLVEQAMGDFDPLSDDIVRINGDTIRKSGKIPTNANIFFSIYQAMTGGPADKPYYTDYPKDFFDLIIIDECHRGGAGKESNWRAVLDHFTEATHLGLTATPKRNDNVDTYEYFGNPKYTYSLQQGIEDGFLTPFKVKRIQTTMDRYTFGYGDSVQSGEIEEGKEYTLNDFNRGIYLPEREERMVEIMLDHINPNEKTIVFCADEKHAAMVRDAVNKYKDSSGLGAHADYCVRITASEKEIGDQFLREFRDNDKQIPTIVTTSRKLSTGVDSRNVRFIVLMRKIGSMVEFKQIIGRGTRIYDGKDYFTIVDFYGNDEKFSDPEWDGEPAEVDETTVKVAESEQPIEAGPAVRGEEAEEGMFASDDTREDQPKREKIIVKLADGKARSISHSSDMQFYFNGRPVSPQQFLEEIYGELPEFFTSEEDLRRQWQDPVTRQALLQGLAERGFDESKLQALKDLVDAQDSDVYDVLRYIAYASQIITRRERVTNVRSDYLESFSGDERTFVQFVLDTYEQSGENELTMENLKQLLELKFKTTDEAIKAIGSSEEIVSDYKETQKALYIE